MNRLCYNGRPIASISALAADLGVSERQLRYTAKKSQSLYRLVQQKEKTDGSLREIVEARYPLKLIQGRIRDSLFSRVQFPSYLTGGIKGWDNVKNATQHVGAKVLIVEDIEDFFPSITDDHVLMIWKVIFKFPPEVASFLTALTTKGGELPQGASTSTYLANCMFGANELKLATKLTERALTYTRYVDDISVSSQKYLCKDEIELVESSLWGMVASRGFRMKRSKHQIQAQGTRMMVTGLTINKRSNLPKSYERSIRYQLRRLERVARESQVDKRLLQSIKGKLTYLARFQPNKAKPLEERLRAIKYVSAS